MNHSTRKPRLPLLALLLCSAFAAAPAWAAPTTDPAELAQLAALNRQERITCLKVPVASERADCLQDANAAYGHARRHRASDIDPPYAQNATRRCDALVDDDRRDCLARMGGLGTTSGTAAEGGIYRELVTFETVAVPPPSVASTPAPASTPVTVTTVTTVTTATTVPAAAASPTPPSATNSPTTPK